jgi:alkylation response protein AidB-like acyl-CoA dehydrogenase/putative sterol carrier protein
LPSIYFKDEHEAFREQVRAFLVREVAPHARAWEAAGRIPREIFVRMGELGFLGISAPEAYGGAGADLFFAVAFLEELPRSTMGGFCAAVSVQQFMATPHILRAGSEELKRRYVAESIAGRKVGALAVTEPDAGSDVAALRTSATRQGDAYLVNGAKTFITNGAEGDFYTVAVRIGSEPGAAGIGLLVVDADTPGVRVSSRLAKLGWHCSDTAEIVFENARVPVGHLIGEERSGFAQLMQSFALERLCAAAIAVGSADVVLEETLRHLAQRRAFGQPLASFQALRHRLADLAAELAAGRQLTWHTAWLLERGEPAMREAAMAKLVTTELGKRIADECLQMFGGYGFMEEYPVARFYRDARGATITAGTSEIMREIIARAVVDEWTPPAVPQETVAPFSRQRSPSQPPAPPAAPAPIEAEPSSPTAPGERTTVEALMTSLPERLRADRARGWSGVFHCTVRGAAAPQWTVRIDDGRCSVERGHTGRADCRIETNEETFVGLETGLINPQTAFLMGKIKVTDLTLLMRFVRAFKGSS